MTFLFAGVIMSLVACGNRGVKKHETIDEDLTAKKNLQGIWLNDDDNDVAFRVKGDTVYFPDSTSAPAYFRVERDSFVIVGGNTVKYRIVRQSPNVFVFVNQNGEQIKLLKTDDQSYLDLFSPKTVLHVNQNKVVKHDTVIYNGDEKYHCYVQINPTTYKVGVASYNDDGVEVDNVYYDNIVNINIFQGANKLFGKDFHKEDFKQKVPAEFLKQAILSDIVFQKVDADGIHYLAVLAMPDSSLSYQVEFVISHSGKMMIK